MTLPVTFPARTGSALLAGSAALLVIVLLASLALGTREIPLATVLDALTAPRPGDPDHAVILTQRVPRTIMGLLVGAALGMAGTLMQGLTRNPLADPGILGINAGASLAVVLAITLLGVTHPAGFVWFAVLGAAAAAIVVYLVGMAGRGGGTPVNLALAGIALTAGINSVIMMVLLTDPQRANAYRFWQVGSLAGRGTGDGADAAAALLPCLLAGGILALLSARPLNLLALGDDVARGLGVQLGLVRTLVALAIVLLAGGATALGGPISFVGLVVPHLIRPVVGPDHRWLLAHAAVLGPALVLTADVLGRLIARPGEVEAGIVVAAVGAPAMIALVRRRKVAGL